MSLTIRTTLAIAAVSAAAATLTGCSSDSSGGSPSSTASPASTASTSASSESSQSSTSAAESTTATGSSGASGSAELEQALITAADLGSDFEIRDVPTSDDPLPCTPNDPPFYTQFKPAQKASKQFTNAARSLAISEDVAVFASGEAERAFAAGVRGFSCSTATAGGARLKIVKRAGGASSGDTESAAWDVTDGKNLGTAAILRIGDKIATMTFAANKAGANDVNVNTVLAKAGTKLAALG